MVYTPLKVEHTWQQATPLCLTEYMNNHPQRSLYTFPQSNGSVGPVSLSRAQLQPQPPWSRREPHRFICPSRTCEWCLGCWFETWGPSLMSAAQWNLSGSLNCSSKQRSVPQSTNERGQVSIAGLVGDCWDTRLSRKEVVQIGMLREEISVAMNLRDGINVTRKWRKPGASIWNAAFRGNFL